MTIEDELRQRGENKCELCSANDELRVYDVPPSPDGRADQCVLICKTCHTQIEGQEDLDVHHWRTLNDSMWNTQPAVQVMAWRMLTRLSLSESWARDLLDMLYLDDETLNWAKSGADEKNDDTTLVHTDANGAVLQAGDTVTLIKDLNVKGAGFTAKRGTAVRSISLVDDNPDHIEGRVSGQQIVILTKFVRKST